MADTRGSPRPSSTVTSYRQLLPSRCAASSPAGPPPTITTRFLSSSSSPCILTPLLASPRRTLAGATLAWAVSLRQADEAWEGSDSLPPSEAKEEADAMVATSSTSRRFFDMTSKRPT
eukprot:32785-Hanusia_phi.AAC.1